MTIENVRNDLESILNTGWYSYQKKPDFHHGHAFEVVLKFKSSRKTLIMEWMKDEISDFEQKLALVDDIKRNDGEIRSLIKWNEV
jgi:hypothetical protein